MAKLIEEVVSFKLSYLYKDGTFPENTILNEEIASALENIISELAGPNVIVEAILKE